MRLAVVLLCALVAVQVALLAAPAEAGELVVGYYDKKCRGVENVVQWHVRRAPKTNRRAGAALVRLLFHDCFVRVRTPPPPPSISLFSVTPAGHCYAL